MNLYNYRTSLRASVGNPSTTDVPNTELDSCINEAVQEISDKYRFHNTRRVITFETVADVTLYQLPADCAVLMKVLYPTGNTKLTKRDETWWAENGNTEQTGVPTDYIRRRDWIELFVVPDDAYTIKLIYKSIVPTLSVDADEPLFPSTWDQGVIYLARHKFWDRRGDFQKAVYALNKWKDWVRDKPSELDEEEFADNTEGVVLPTLRRRQTFNTSIDDD